MIKLVYTMRHRDGTTREEFQRYSREHHALLVKRHAETLQIRRYVQVHARATGMDEAVAAARGSEPRVYDGVAELWWDSVGQRCGVFKRRRRGCRERTRRRRATFHEPAALAPLVRGRARRHRLSR